VKAVEFDLTVPRYLLGRALGGITSTVTFGALSGLRLRELQEPPLPGPEWVRLEVLAAGICGTDLAVLTFATGTLMEPFSSFPAVLGHEVVARVAEVGPAVTRVQPGQRVAVEPTVSCQTRGYGSGEICDACEEGFPATCGNAGEEGRLAVDGKPLAPGLSIGYHRDLPGGWGESMIVHQDHLFPLPDELNEGMAVLMEPLSVAVHAVLRSRPDPSDQVLVLGSGPIAMASIWALRATGFEGTVVAQVKRAKEAEVARSLGATEVVAPGPEARQVLVDTGAQAYLPLVGPEVYAGGGFPVVYDCVGRRESLDQALSYSAPRGRITLLGCTGQVRKLDLTFLWARELEVKGYLGYGREEWEGKTCHSFEVTRELLLRTDAPVGEMVTHVFPLRQYRDALKAASNRRGSGAMKVVLKPDL
jgi:threonine dehydrogenase-like Zn-dependent dehydrogenase